jgi:hypothetical protein
MTTSHDRAQRFVRILHLHSQHRTGHETLDWNRKMSRKLMSWISLGTLVAGLVTIAMGIAALIGAVVQDAVNIVPALLQMSFGVAFWTAGVRMTQTANAIESSAPDCNAPAPIALPPVAVTDLAEVRRLRMRLNRPAAIPVPLAA